MDALIEGYHRFRETAWPEHRALFRKLVRNGQAPLAMVVACSDSRVDPQMIFGAGPGELFVVRNVAALVPPYAPDSEYHGTSAAIEFGVRSLGVTDLIVMGHGQCGGIRALLQEPEERQVGDFVSSWIGMAQRARERTLVCERAPEEQQQVCEHEAVKVSIENLMTFPWVRSRVEEGTLRLRGAWFAIESGKLMLLGPDGAFAAV